jgi:glycerol uptake facilitator protein
MFGLGSVAMAALALPGSGRGTVGLGSSADWLVIAFGWGLGVVFGIYVAGGVTGAHLNPAVTLAFALKRGFAWSKVPWYILAQLLGAFVAAALIYALYQPVIHAFEVANGINRGSLRSQADFGIFATSPAPYIGNWWGAFFTEFVATALLVALVFAVVDNYNQPVKANLAPWIIGFIVVAIGLSFGANSGYAINPARDFGPRLWALIKGWGDIAIPGDYANVRTYFWIPIVGPLLGGPVGGYLYDFFVRDVLESRGVPPDVSVEEIGETEVERRGRGEPVEGPPGRAVVDRDVGGEPPPARGAP